VKLQPDALRHYYEGVRRPGGETIERLEEVGPRSGAPSPPACPNCLNVKIRGVRSPIHRVADRGEEEVKPLSVSPSSAVGRINSLLSSAAWASFHYIAARSSALGQFQSEPLEQDLLMLGGPG